MSGRSNGGYLFSSLHGYRLQSIRPDVIAGSTVWAVLVPEALAYASIAGVPPVVGLYAAVPALILYAAIGSSRHLVVGPMSATAALSAAVIAPVAAGNGEAFVALTAALALIAGAAGVLTGIARFGFVASFISEAVLKGFIIGLALTIVIGQVPTLIGVAKTGGNFFEQTWGVLSHIGDIDGPAVILGAASVVLLLILRRWLPLLPGSLLVVAIGIGATTALELDEHGVEVVGHIESGLPRLGLPPDLSLSNYVDLIGPAMSVLLIGFVEGLGAAKNYAAGNGYRVDANRELTALGLANVGSGLCSGMIVNGSLSKTAVNAAAGARSQVSGLTVAALTILTLLFLTGLFEQLPEATLAAVVIVAVIDLVDFAALRALFAVWTQHLGAIYGHTARVDFLAALAALIGVLLFDTLPGLLIGIAVSLLLLIYRVSRPRVALLGRDGTNWVDLERHPDVTAPAKAIVVRVEAGVFFANADYVRDQITTKVRADTTMVVLDAETSPFIDVSAARMFGALRTELGSRGIQFRVAHDIGQFRDVLFTALPERVPVYPSVTEALASGEP